MNITRHNCEAAFLDYYEKNLSPVEVAEVLFFLEENPDMKEMFEAYEEIFLEHSKINFPDKESLKKKYSSEELNTILASEIDKTNCEQFFIASTEGILSSEQTEKLNSFLRQNPELQNDLELFQKCKLPEEKISFEYKNTLKKEPINAENREEYFIRSIEHDLSLREQKNLAAFLHENPEYKSEFEQFKKTILTAEKISFEFKAQLKKRERKPVFVAIFSQRTTYYAAAAAVLLLAGLFFFFRNDDNNGIQLAYNTKQANTRNESTEPAQHNNTSIERQKVKIQQKDESVNTQEQQTAISKTVFANKKTTAPESEVKESEKTTPSPILTQDNSEDKLTANKTEEKKPDQTENIVAEKNKEEKKDSASSEDQITGAVLASAETSVQGDKNEYQSLNSFINKKIRNVLGIKNSTECATSDKLSLWDVAMAAKNGVQKILGTKAIDVNKICDGTGEKVEYVFAAGNFEISKSAAK